MRTSRAAVIATACVLVAALLAATPATADAVRWSHLDGRDSGKPASGLSSWVDASNLKRTGDLTPESWWGNDSSWNRYSYVSNNPLAMIDPDGKARAAVQGATDEQTKAMYDSAMFVATGGLMSGGVTVAGTEAAASAGKGLLGKLKGLVSKVKSLFGNGADDAAKAADNLAGAVQDIESAAAGGSKSASEMAGDVAESLGQNRVSTQTGGGQRIDIDLQGKAHFDKAPGTAIETPHVHEATVNVGPSGEINLGDKTTRAATKQDIRTAQELVKRRNP